MSGTCLLHSTAERATLFFPYSVRASVPRKKEGAKMRTQVEASYDDGHAPGLRPEEDDHAPGLPPEDEDHIYPLLLEDGDDVEALLSWAGALF
jgi:hypothetical protein